ncbi:MAG: hypothetical protein JW855_04815 [Gammaproteobacteria bacterium]|nr:hypothetical protein [Gammaproteobacteria bacterium]
MKNVYKNQIVKCDTVEDLLIKQSIEILSADENSLLENHLKTCVHCQEYQNQLVSIQSSMTIDQKSQLKPDPAIHQLLKQRMNAFKPIKHRTVDSPWQRFRNILEYRIPVYQGLIGLACSILIFVAINYFSLSNHQQTRSSEYSINMADTTFYQINVINNLQIIEQQKIGRNVKEDSLLTRFIVSSM